MFALAGAITDITGKRIPNALCAAGAAFGCTFHVTVNGWLGIVTAIGGLAAGFVLSLALHLVGAVGAGDVKWFAAAGAMAGSLQVAIILLFAVFVSGLAGCMAFVCSSEFRRSVRFMSIELFYAVSFPASASHSTLKKISVFRFPFMVSVLAALTLLHLDAVRWM